MSSVIDSTGTVKIIKVTAPRSEKLTAADVKNDPEKVARIINAQTDAIAAIYPKLPQEYTEFEFHMVATNRYALPHNYNGAVRVELVNWVADTFGANWFPYLLEVWPINSGGSGLVSDANTLVVEASSQTTGTATFRVSPRGV